MRANLLLFKTVIAGDSWGEIAVPVIEANPATAIIFCGSLLTLVFGVLNMVVAVVVDGFAEGRQNDVLNLAEDLEFDHQVDKKNLSRIFDRLDATSTGELTLEEIVKGAQTDPEFQSRLRVMDIDAGDLEQLFGTLQVFIFLWLFFLLLFGYCCLVVVVWLLLFGCCCLVVVVWLLLFGCCCLVVVVWLLLFGCCCLVVVVWLLLFGCCCLVVVVWLLLFGCCCLVVVVWLLLFGCCCLVVVVWLLLFGCCCLVVVVWLLLFGCCCLVVV